MGNTLVIELAKANAFAQMHNFLGKQVASLREFKCLDCISADSVHVSQSAASAELVQSSQFS